MSLRSSAEFIALNESLPRSSTQSEARGDTHTRLPRRQRRRSGLAPAGTTALAKDAGAAADRTAADTLAPGHLLRGTDAAAEGGALIEGRTSWIFTAEHGTRSQAHESPLAALSVAEGPFAHLVKWGRVEFRPLVDTSEQIHDFAGFCAARALAIEISTGRKSDPLLHRTLVMKDAWRRGELSCAELEDGRRKLLAQLDFIHNAPSRHALRAVYYASSRTDIWIFASHAARETTSMHRSDAGASGERQLQDRFLRSTLFRAQSERMKLLGSDGVWAMLDGIRVIPSETAGTTRG